MARLKFEGQTLVYNSKGVFAPVPKKNGDKTTSFQTVDDFIKGGGLIKSPHKAGTGYALIEKKSATILRKRVDKISSVAPIEVDAAEQERYAKMQKIEAAKVEKTTIANSDYIDTVR